MWSLDSILFQTWETRYILLLWLSIVVMIPFELSRFDGGLPGAGGGAPQGRVADRIMEVAKVRKGVQVFLYNRLALGCSV